MNLSKILKEQSDGLRLEVLVSPRASRSKIIAVHDDRLKLKLAAAPVDGEVNVELISFLSEIFDLPKRSLRVLSGLSSKRKSIGLTDLSLDQAKQILLRHLINLA